MADEAFLASFAVDIDEAGVARLDRIFADLTQRAETAAAALGGADEALRTLFSLDVQGVPSGGERNESGRQGVELRSVLADLSDALSRLTAGGMGGESGGGLPQGEGSAGFAVELDWTKATASVQSFLAEASSRFRLTADAEGVISAARSALSVVRALFAATKLSLAAEVRLSEEGTRAAPSISSSTAGTLANVGQLSAGGQIAAGSALSLADAATYLQAAPAVASEPVTVTSQRTVEAPVTIQVTAQSADPEAIGRSVYDCAERYLTNALKGGI